MIYIDGQIDRYIYRQIYSDRNKDKIQIDKYIYKDYPKYLEEHLLCGEDKEEEVGDRRTRDRYIDEYKYKQIYRWIDGQIDIKITS